MENERDGSRLMPIHDYLALQNLRKECEQATAKSKYDQLAKEAKRADKEDLTNKFTCAGESYAQMNQRVSQERREEKVKEEILSNLTMEGPGLNGQKFVVFNSINVCEVGYPPDSEFLPSELAIGSFSIATGHISNYHTLVDIVNIPLGHEAQAKDNFVATALPCPGSHRFKPAHRNYFKILQNLKRFIQSYVTPVHGFYPVFIKPDNDKPVDEQVLKWMVKESRRIGPYDGFDSEAENELYDFFNYLKFLKVTKLLLRLRGVARERCPTFRSHVASFNYLENPADHVLSAGVYDCFPNTTCSYHNLSTKGTESMKMNRCCLNIVLRTIFVILRDVMPGMNVQTIMSHTPQQSINPQPPFQPEAKVPESEPKRHIRSEELKRKLPHDNSLYRIPLKRFRFPEIRDEKVKCAMEDMACQAVSTKNLCTLRQLQENVLKELQEQRKNDLANGLADSSKESKRKDRNLRKAAKQTLTSLKLLISGPVEEDLWLPEIIHFGQNTGTIDQNHSRPQQKSPSRLN